MGDREKFGAPADESGPPCRERERSGMCDQACTSSSACEVPVRRNGVPVPPVSLSGDQGVAYVTTRRELPHPQALPALCASDVGRAPGMPPRGRPPRAEARKRAASPPSPRPTPTPSTPPESVRPQRSGRPAAWINDLSTLATSGSPPRESGRPPETRRGIVSPAISRARRAAKPIGGRIAWNGPPVCGGAHGWIKTAAVCGSTGRAGG